MPTPPPPPPAEDTRTRATKRKASPDETSARKKTRVSGSPKHPEGVLNQAAPPANVLQKKRRLLIGKLSTPNCCRRRSQEVTFSGFRNVGALLGSIFLTHSKLKWVKPEVSNIFMSQICSF